MRATLASYYPEIGTESRNSYHISALLSGVARVCLLGYNLVLSRGSGAFPACRHQGLQRH